MTTANANVRILDIRSKDDYLQGHLPRAVYVDLNDWKALAASRGGLHDAAGWSQRVAHLGIERELPVIVCGDRLSDTARVWWLLKYVGVRNTAILDGGWQSWVAEGRPTETSVPSVSPTVFEAEFQAGRLQEIDGLKTAIAAGEVRAVDARSADEFTGREVRGPRGGHIPGAVHVEWKELLADDGKFKKPLELSALFRDRGVAPDETAVCY